MDTVRCLFLCTTAYNACAFQQVAGALPGWDCRFSPFNVLPTPTYRLLDHIGFIGKTPLAANLRESVALRIRELGLPLDMDRRGPYDLVVLGNDFFVPEDIREISPKVLVQEGWLWPYHWRRRLVTTLHLPPLFASANGSGLSRGYTYFCVASEGYRNALASKICPDKLIVTGLPLLDHVQRDLGSLIDDISMDFVLLATHPGREYYEGERRRALLRKTRVVAAGRPIVVKFHPHEKQGRALQEIEKWLPEAQVVTNADVFALIANCAALVTTYSTVIFYAMLMGKPVFCSYATDKIEELLPEQNGEAAYRIAEVCRRAVADV